MIVIYEPDGVTVANVLVGDAQTAGLFEGGEWVADETELGIGWRRIVGSVPASFEKPSDGQS